MVTASLSKWWLEIEGCYIRTIVARTECWHYLKWRFVDGVQKYNTPSTGVRIYYSARKVN
jgi:hypothetical protein